jgi:hypothetical protein
LKFEHPDVYSLKLMMIVLEIELELLNSFFSQNYAKGNWIVEKHDDELELVLLSARSVNCNN